MKKAVISIAAGKNQLLIIKKAKELGFSVIGIDKDPAAAGFFYCDEKINLSTYESAPILEYLKQYSDQYEIIGVLNRSSGTPVITAAEICRDLNLPNIEPSMAKIIIDKSLLMDFCNKNNISVPWHTSIKSINDLDLNIIKFPCIVKPSLSVYGKRGVTKVEDEKSLVKALELAKIYSESGVIEIEEYIYGRDITLMSVVYRGNVHTITLLDEENEIGEGGEIYAKSYSVPSMFTGQREEKDIIQLANVLVDRLKIDTSIFLMSCRCEYNKEPKLIEIHLDFGGDLILDKLIPASTNFDILSYFISVLSNSPLNVPDIYFKPTAVLYSVKNSHINKPYLLVHAETFNELSAMIKNHVVMSE